MPSKDIRDADIAGNYINKKLHLIQLGIQLLGCSPVIEV
ncbi:hypothetical protein YPPY01_3344 [Yersinia pestis PY-01]|nr:hypothetical protein YPPY01_3344 [Yersinia pestis PY-01]EIS54060.1 hypothetical protein YPPY61_3460 [Yersinia pestis PY-61]EIT27467.1 hypothetical protein YPPY96_3328 [Yersinia pestis PY-96]